MNEKNVTASAELNDNSNNAKCPFCGAELYVKYTKGGGFCPSCKKKFDCEKAVKLYKSVHETESGGEKKVAKGEDYLEVERILERTEFYLKNKRFDEAKAELSAALKLTDSDYRVYFGFVRAETANLTDYKNESHKTWLEKAFNCADAEEKTIIRRLYKEYYQVAELSEEDRLEYKNERNAAKKLKLEEKLKELIPKYMKTARGLSSKLIFGSVLCALGFAAVIFGLFTALDIVSLCGVAALAAACVLIRLYVTDKRQNAMFNAALDLYDAMPSFKLSPDVYFELLEGMKACVKPFLKRGGTHECEEGLTFIVRLLLESGDESAVEFITQNRVLSGFIEYAELEKV